jgi:hypothetical protein
LPKFNNVCRFFGPVLQNVLQTFKFLKWHKWKNFFWRPAICHSEFPGLEQAGGVRRFPYAGVSAGSFPGPPRSFFPFPVETD